jgi:hypothetical protein
MATQIADLKTVFILILSVSNLILIIAIPTLHIQSNRKCAKEIKELEARSDHYLRIDYKLHNRNMHIADSVIRKKTDTSLMYFIHEYNDTEEWKRIQSLE